jgi:hypothetical protein
LLSCLSCELRKGIGQVILNLTGYKIMALKTATEATLVRRRRRRSVAPSAVTLAKTIVDSMLALGNASQKDMEIVLGWVRNVGTEADALKELVKRPRRAKAEGGGERIAKLELNKALLQGLLAGELAVSVSVDGDIVFTKK